MELRTCEFCGTEYNRELPACPLCGKTSREQMAAQQNRNKTRLASASGARASGRNSKKKKASAKSQKNWAIACVVLGIAVLIGILAFFVQMDFFRDFDPNAIPTLQQEPQEQPEYNYEQGTVQPEEEAPAPEEPQEPEVTDPNACTELIISQEAVTIDEYGGRVFLTAVARPTTCKDPITFASEDETVAQVNENGMITGVGPGETNILVRCGSVVTTCRITCDFEVAREPEEEETPAEEEETEAEETEPEEADAQTEEEPEETAASVELSTTDFTLFYPGENTWLTVKNAPEGAQISYVSSHAGVVTVTNDGMVTAVGDGDCTITVTVGDQVLKCTARCRLSGSTDG